MSRRVIQRRGGDFGLGGLASSFLLVYSRDEEWAWGVGPAFLFPTATSSETGSGKWTAGPVVVARYDGLPNWGFAIEMGNVWSFAGDPDEDDINEFGFVPYVGYALPFQKTTYVFTAPFVNIDWTAKSDERWSVPLGLGVGFSIVLARLSLSGSSQAYWYAVRSEDAAHWSLAFAFGFVILREDEVE